MMLIRVALAALPSVLSLRCTCFANSLVIPPLSWNVFVIQLDLAARAALLRTLLVLLTSNADSLVVSPLRCVVLLERFIFAARAALLQVLLLLTNLANSRMMFPLRGAELNARLRKLTLRTLLLM